MNLPLDAGLARVADWGGGCVIYRPLEGTTHLVAPEAAEWLRRAASHPGLRSPAGGETSTGRMTLDQALAQLQRTERPD